MVKKILHVEGLAVFLTAIYLYHSFGFNWLLFFLLFLTPDISMIGYVRNKAIGALYYNAVHNYILVGCFIAAGLFLKNDVFLSLGIILMAHIGLDRLLGFGLKYQTHFKDTHLQKV